MTTQNSAMGDEKLRDQLEDISCEYGRPHEDSCDLNAEEGAVNGCTCSVGDLLDKVTKFIKSHDQQIALAAQDALIAKLIEKVRDGSIEMIGINVEQLAELKQAQNKEK